MWSAQPQPGHKRSAKVHVAIGIASPYFGRQLAIAAAYTLLVFVVGPLFGIVLHIERDDVAMECGGKQADPSRSVARPHIARIWDVRGVRGVLEFHHAHADVSRIGLATRRRVTLERRNGPHQWVAWVDRSGRDSVLVAPASGLAGRPPHCPRGDLPPTALHPDHHSTMERGAVPPRLPRSRPVSRHSPLPPRPPLPLVGDPPHPHPRRHPYV